MGRQVGPRVPRFEGRRTKEEEEEEEGNQEGESLIISLIKLYLESGHYGFLPVYRRRVPRRMATGNTKEHQGTPRVRMSTEKRECNTRRKKVNTARLTRTTD